MFRVIDQNSTGIIGKWFLVIGAINIISWTFFPNTMRELTKFEAEWRNYKLKKWARLKEKNGE